MALQYFLYNTDYDGTIVDRSDTSFSPSAPYGEIYIDFLIPEIQPVYLYANNGGTGGTIVINSQENVDNYLASIAPPPQPEDEATKGYVTGITSQLQADIDVISGFTTTGATLQAVTTLGATTTNETTFSDGVVTNRIKPSGDTVTAIQITKTDGITPVINIDTVSGLTGFGTTAPQGLIHAHGTDIRDDGYEGQQINNIIIDGVAGADKDIAWYEDGDPRWLAETYRNEDSEFWYLYAVDADNAPITAMRTGLVGINKQTNLLNYHAAQKVGTGLDDINVSGEYTQNYNTVYQIEIYSTTGATDEYYWRKSINDGNTFDSYSAPSATTTTATELEFGVFIDFGSVVGHTIGDLFQFAANSQIPQATLSIAPFSVNEILVTTDYTAGTIDYRDVSAILNGGVDLPSITIFNTGSTTDSMVFGYNVPVHSMFLKLTDVGAGITLVAEYWDNVISGWTSMDYVNNFFIDSTDNLTKSEQIIWNPQTFINWNLALIPDYGEEKYWVRIRTSSLPTKAPSLLNVSVGNDKRFSVYGTFADVRPNFYVDALGRTNIGGGNVTGTNLFQVNNAQTFITNADADSVVEIDNEDSSIPIIQKLRLASDDAQAPVMLFAKTRGTLSAPANIENGDILGAIAFSSLFDCAVPFIGAAICGEYTGNGSDYYADLVFNTASGVYFTPTEKVRISSGGTGFGGIVPTAVVHLQSGSTAAGTAPLKFTTGDLLTTPETGAVEFNNNCYYGTNATGRHCFAFMCDSASIDLQGVTDNGAVTTNETIFTGGLVLSDIRPSGDSVNAIRINKTDGVTPVISVDTVSGLTGFGTIAPQNQIHLYGTDNVGDEILGLQQNGIILDGAADIDKQIQWAQDGEIKWTAETYRNEDSEFWYLWNQETDNAPITAMRTGRVGINNPIALLNGHTSQIVGDGLNDLSVSGFYTQNYNSVYNIEIYSTSGATDEYQWRASIDGGLTFGSYSAPSGVTTGATTLEHGVEIGFRTVTGHTIGDVFKFIAHTQIPQATFAVTPFPVNEILITDDYTAGTIEYVNVTADLNGSSTLTNKTIFNTGNTDGALYFGYNTIVHSLFFTLDGVEGIGVTLVFEYYNGTSWVAINNVSNDLIDYTNNFEINGQVIWSPKTFINWSKSSVPDFGHGNLYWMRVRTSSIPTTAPVIGNLSVGNDMRVAAFASANDPRPAFFVDALGRTSIGGENMTSCNLLQVGNVNYSCNESGFDSQVQFESDDENSAALRLRLSYEGPQGYCIGFAKNRGCPEDPQPVQNGDSIGNILWGSAVGSISTGVLLADIGTEYTGDGTTKYGDIIFKTHDDDVGPFPKEVVRMSGSGNTGFGGITTPTARIHVTSGSTTTAPLKFNTGDLLSSPQEGAVEFDGQQWYGTITGDTRKTFAFLESPVFTGTPELPIGTTLNSVSLSDYILNSGGTNNDSLLKVTEFNDFTGTTTTILAGISADISYVSGVTDTKLFISDFNTYTGTSTPWASVDKTGSDLADLETKNAIDVDYTNSDWDIIEVKDALDKLTSYTDDTQGSGRLTPEDPLGGRLTTTLTISGGTGYINYTGFHKEISWSATTLDVSTGFTEGTYYVYVDSNEAIQTSTSEPNIVDNILLGFFYWGGSVIGIIQQCGCIIKSSINGIVDFALRQGYFIYDNGGAINLLSGSTTKIVSPPCKVQYGLLSTQLTEVGSDDASTLRFMSLKKSVDEDWEINYYFSLVNGGAIPPNRWNDITQPSASGVTASATFTSGSTLVTSATNLTGYSLTDAFVFLSADTHVNMTPVSAVTWTGSQTEITLKTPYQGAGGTGTLIADYSLPKLQAGKYAKHLVARASDDTMYYIFAQTYYDTEDEAIGGTLPTLPESIAPAGIKMATIVTTFGMTDLTGHIYDIRPLPYHDREGGQEGGGTTISVHSELSGLGADDHQQYLLTSGARTLTGIQRYGSHPTFTTDLDVVDKKYVDDNKLAITDFNTFTGTTLPADYYNKTEINTYTGTTAPATYLNKIIGGVITGDVSITQSLFVTGTTESAGVIAGTTIAVLGSDGKLIDSTTSINSISSEVFDISTSQIITDLFGVYYVDTTAGDVTIQVPDASADNDGSKIVVIKNGGTNNVIVTTTGGTQNIGATTSVTISQSDKGITILSDDGNNKWLKIQDSRFVQGTITGEFQYWDNTLNSWKPTGSDLLWDNGTSGLTASGNVGGLTVSENGTTLSEIYLSIGNFNTYSGVTDTLIGTKAPIASPTLTGIPAAPTANEDTSTTQIATTAYVLNQASDTNPIMDGSVAIGTGLHYAREDHVHASDTSRLEVSVFDTYTGTTQPVIDSAITGATNLGSAETIYTSVLDKKLQLKSISGGTGIAVTTVGGQINIASTNLSAEWGNIIGTLSDQTDLQNALNLKANLVSPTFTGIPAAPTPAANTSTTQLATTAYVVGQASDSNPLMDGTVAIGTGLRYARQDHVHASNTSKLDISSFNIYSGVTDTTLTSLQDQINSYSGVTGLSSVQIRRTTNLTLTTAYQNITFDITDIENQPDVIEHDNTNTERINIKEDGLYLISFDSQATNTVGITDGIDLELVKNVGNVLLNGGDSRISIYGDDIQQIQKTFLVDLISGDYVFGRIKGDTTNGILNSPVTLSLVLLEGVKGTPGDKGDKGDAGAGSSVAVFEDGVNVQPTGGTFTTLNFTTGFNLSGGTEQVNIAASAPPLALLVDSVGGQEMDNVTPVALTWGTNNMINTTYFTHTVGASSTTVLVTGLYEISYNINADNQTNARSTSGVQVRLNGTTTLGD